eukprot:2454556-Rhodomonas_salina.1
MYVLCSHVPSTQGSTSHGSIEVLQPPPPIEPAAATSVVREDSMKRTERGKSPGRGSVSPMRARAASVEGGAQIGVKTNRTNSAGPGTENPEGLDLA